MQNRTLTRVLCIGAVLLLGACSEPQIDPNFKTRLEASSHDKVASLIEEQAERLGVTALSVTILDGEKPTETWMFGDAKEGGLMQVASLSKTVAAAVILTVADQRSVGIDDDIRDQITSLDVAALEGSDRPVTLRQLLSHTTGASSSGFPGYPRDSDLPSTTEIITDPPRFFESRLAFDGEPGVFRYSGGGYVLAQIWAQDVSGQSFEALADDLLFTPLSLTQSTFAQPIDESAIAPLTIIGGNEGFDPMSGIFSAIKNSWHDFPEQAAAGLWSTSDDYARFVSALLQAANGTENAIPAAVAKEIITPQTDVRPNEAYGLGVQLYLGGDASVEHIAHSGSNTGYRALFFAKQTSAGEQQRVVVSLANSAQGAELNQAIVDVLIEP